MENTKPINAELSKLQPKKPFTVTVKEDGKKIYRFDNF